MPPPIHGKEVKDEVPIGTAVPGIRLSGRREVGSGDHCVDPSVHLDRLDSSYDLGVLCDQQPSRRQAHRAFGARDSRVG